MRNSILIGYFPDPQSGQSLYCTNRSQYGQYGWSGLRLIIFPEIVLTLLLVLRPPTDELTSSLLGQRYPDRPRGIMQGVYQSLADRERRRLEQKRPRSPERVTTAMCIVQLLGLGCRRRGRER